MNLLFSIYQIKKFNKTLFSRIMVWNNYSIMSKFFKNAPSLYPFTNSWILSISPLHFLNANDSSPSIICESTIASLIIEISLMVQLSNMITLILISSVFSFWLYLKPAPNKVFLIQQRLNTPIIYLKTSA